ncbi:hypothetical protein [Amycolatopsis sp. NPDC051716]|uniref:hypothetical protein n=1 Tax=Amycolatopsis sp. NPDC051716 TaxID=3155804 RepID=UPI0034497393
MSPHDGTRGRVFGHRKRGGSGQELMVPHAELRFTGGLAAGTSPLAAAIGSFGSLGRERR